LICLKKGYGILDLKDTIAQGNFYSVPTITALNPGQAYETGYYTLANTRWLKKATTESTKLDPKFYQAPETPRQNIITGIRNKSTDLIVLSAYPNPFIDRISIQFNTASNTTLDLKIFDMTGRLVKQQDLGYLTKGLYIKSVNLEELASGAYKLVLSNNNELIERTIEKF
jgi:hypothetical protein